MWIRPLRSDEPDEIATFAALGGHPEDAAVPDYLRRMFVAGTMRPGWCYLAVNAARPLARIALYGPKGEDVPSDIVFMDIPLNDWEVGDRLMRETLRRARALGAASLDYVIDTLPMSPHWHDHPELRSALLEHIGFTQLRETRRFDQRSNVRPIVVPTRLIYRSLDDVGEQAFVAALARVTADSLDQRMQRGRAESGPEGDAVATIALLRQISHEPAWWQLAYTPDEELVGLVMPAGNATFATIGFIGVVPEQRGRGYIDDLLARGTATLLATGANRLIADTDVANAPMANAFRRVGWVEFATRREYRVELAEV